MKTAILLAAKHLRLFHVARWLLRGRLLTLCYHGFELRDEAAFRPTLFMRPETFRRRLEIIARGGFTVLSHADAMRRLDEGRVPPNALVITIDDGFKSVKHVAGPELTQHGFPSTLYATTKRIEIGTPVFRLVLQYMFWKSQQDFIEFPENSWIAAGRYDLREPEHRESLCFRLIEAGYQSGEESARDAICHALAALLQVDYDAIVQSEMFTLVSPDDLRALERDRMDIQLHTHTHKVVCDGGTARREVLENARRLDRWLQKRCTHFCYPNGKWNRSSLEELERLALESAVTTDRGWNGPRTNRLALYRFVDGEHVSELEFEAELYGFTEILRILSGRRRRAELLRQPAPRRGADPEASIPRG